MQIEAVFLQPVRNSRQLHPPLDSFSIRFLLISLIAVMAKWDLSTTEFASDTHLHPVSGAIVALWDCSGHRWGPKICCESLCPEPWNCVNVLWFKTVPFAKVFSGKTSFNEAWELPLTAPNSLQHFHKRIFALTKHQPDQQFISFCKSPAKQSLLCPLQSAGNFS